MFWKGEGSASDRKEGGEIEGGQVGGGRREEGEEGGMESERRRGRTERMEAERERGGAEGRDFRSTKSAARSIVLREPSLLSPDL